MTDNKGKTFYGIGRMYSDANEFRNFEQNKESAIKFFTKSAELGYSDGQFALAKILLWNKNPEQAFHWMLEAAKLGHPKAMYEIASYYGSGIGCTVDDDACESWFVKAGGLPHA